MVGVLTLFGETDLQPVLSKLFLKHNIFFVKENCTTSVQLQMQIEEHGKEIDVVIINGNAVHMDSFTELVSDIRSVDERMRILFILNGTPKDYLREQLSAYKTMQLDLIFDDKGFDANELVELVKLGKLPKHAVKERKHAADDFGVTTVDTIRERKS